MYESGERTPRDKNVYEKLAEHYNTPVEFWTEDKEDDGEKIDDYSKYRKAQNTAKRVIEDVKGLFSGGALPDEDKYKVIKALEQTFWEVDNKTDKNPFD